MFCGTTELIRAAGTTLVFGAFAIFFWSDILAWARQGDFVLKGYSIEKKAQPFSYAAALALFMFIALMFTWLAFRAALFTLAMLD